MVHGLGVMVMVLASGLRLYWDLGFKILGLVFRIRGLGFEV
jgi:hypothetical protein